MLQCADFTKPFYEQVIQKLVGYYCIGQIKVSSFVCVQKIEQRPKELFSYRTGLPRGHCVS